MRFEDVKIEVSGVAFELWFAFKGGGPQLSDIFVAANFGDDSIWFDTYGKTNTTYAEIDLDQAEQLGYAILTAVKVARGEIDPESIGGQK